MSESAPSGPRKSYVYAIGGADQRLVKIGYTIDPKKRLTFIQTTCPFPVSILWMEEGGAELEGMLHGHFADVRAHGEWFEFTGDAATLIGKAYAGLPKRPADGFPVFEVEPSISQFSVEENCDGAVIFHPPGLPPAPYSACGVVAPQSVAEALCLPAGTRVLREQRVISKDGVPIEVLVSWVREGCVVGGAISVLPDGTRALEDPDGRWTVRNGRPYRAHR
jgi:hypothetical protein